MAERQKEWQNGRMAEMATLLSSKSSSSLSLTSLVLACNSSSSSLLVSSVSLAACTINSTWNGGTAEWRNG